MTNGFLRKTVLFALVIALFACCVFLACACEDKGTVTVDFSVGEDLVAGSAYSFLVTYTGSPDLVAAYQEEACTFLLSEGGDIASIGDGRLVISEDAHKGDTFTVLLTVGDLSLEKEFTVSADKPIVIERVRVLCEGSARAGETISLSAEILPLGVNILPVYTVLSGDAEIEGNLLKISESADEGEIRVVATAGGVVSGERVIAVTTVQTRALYLT